VTEEQAEGNALKRVELASDIELDVIDTGAPETLDGVPAEDYETLIFLHGFPESHRTWRHQITHFASKYRCIAPDQRGYRGSSKPENVDDYRPEKLIQDVFELADALGVDTFTILGHDWGGAIAWGTAYAGQANGRVTRAVIANAPHPAIFGKLLWTNETQRRASQYIRGFRNPENDALVAESGLIGVLMKEVDMGRPTSMEPEIRAELMEDWKDPATAMAMLNWYRASPVDVPPLDAPYELPAGYSAPQLPKLTIPTLVIWALDDTALPPENLEGMDEQIADLTLVEVPDCGHFVPWEAPHAVNRALDEFLPG
jgi:pimeloyl-ACP methyl ester carboxylesterase